MPTRARREIEKNQLKKYAPSRPGLKIKQRRIGLFRRVFSRFQIISACLCYFGAMRSFLIFLFALCSVASGEATWRIEAQTGSAHSFETTLTIDQPQGNDFRFQADYETKPFQSAPYSAWRISRWKNENGWEFEFLHHKIYLKNTPPGITTFRISNGYNMLFLNHAWERSRFVVRTGAGAVVAFPISSIEGVITDGGYRLAGLAAQASISKRFYIFHQMFLSLEGKVTVARAKVTLNQEVEATAPNVALHGLAGIGFDF